MQGCDVDWPSLTERIACASRASFSDLIGRGTGERFYAFILYTDADCYTVLPSANSIEKHLEKMSREGISDPKNLAGYKWSIGEWTYEAWHDEGFHEICEALSVASQSAYENGAFPAFRQQVHASMIKALALLDGEGFFESLPHRPVLFISSSDHDEAIDLENDSARQLNPPDLFREFLARFDIRGNGLE